MPSFRSLCLVGGALAAFVATGADGGSPPSAPSRLPAPGAPAVPRLDPEGPQAIVALGRTLPLPTANGRVVDVTALAVRLRRGSGRLIDVRLRYELRSGAAYRMEPAREAQVVDGSGQLLTATLDAGGRRPALKPALLQPGRPLAGWVTFVRPTAARVVRVQLTLDAGSGPRTGQWRVSLPA
jgi:hypothetical protein